jgi:DNA polymerase III subunit epsilon
MREIVLDTETTGLDPAKGDRLVEIGAVEIIDKVATGRTFHVLVNPERDVPEDAYRVHGHSTESLRDKPVFAVVVGDFLAFIGEDPLIIHNAEFDVRFLNSELRTLGRAALAAERIVDTLALARRKHPGSANSLDALCDRYRIDRSRRIKHGALLDAEILVDVYCELSGGRQRTLGLAPSVAVIAAQIRLAPTHRPIPLPPRVTANALSAHRTFVENAGAPAIWLRYLAPSA